MFLLLRYNIFKYITNDIQILPVKVISIEIGKSKDCKLKMQSDLFN